MPIFVKKNKNKLVNVEDIMNHANLEKLCYSYVPKLYQVENQHLVTQISVPTQTFKQLVYDSDRFTGA